MCIELRARIAITNISARPLIHRGILYHACVHTLYLRGVIQEEAEAKCGGEAKLNAAVAAGSHEDPRRRWLRVFRV